jgi:antitoxin component of MazEF toxin-antitoxin module
MTPPESATPPQTENPAKPGLWASVQTVIRHLNAYAGLLNVILGIIGALFLVNEWHNRVAETRIKAIEALSGSAAQSRAAILYLVQLGADLAHQNLSGVNASGLSIEDAAMSDVRLDNANLIDASLTGDLSALSVRCAEISNLSLDNTQHVRPVDARGARLGGANAPVKKWNAPVLYTPAEVLEALGKNIGQGLKSEIAVSQYLRARPGAQAEASLPYCLYERLKAQGAKPEALCRGMTWDGVSC